MRAVTSIDWMTATISVITPDIPLGPYWNCEYMNGVNNYMDLLRLARRLFALDTADAVHVLIDVGQGRGIPPGAG